MREQSRSLTSTAGQKFVRGSVLGKIAGAIFGVRGKALRKPASAARASEAGVRAAPRTYLGRAVLDVREKFSEACFIENRYPELLRLLKFAPRLFARNDEVGLF